MKKPVLHGVVIACSLWCLSGLAPAQEKKAEAVQGDIRQVRVQVEFIDVSHEQLTELIFAESLPANDAELRKQVAQLVKDGKAAIVETMLCIAAADRRRPPNRSRSSSIRPNTSLRRLPLKDSSKDKDDKEPTKEPTKEVVRDNATGPTPTAFETRNLGSTMEIEPTLSDDKKIVELRFVPGDRLSCGQPGLGGMEGRTRQLADPDADHLHGAPQHRRHPRHRPIHAAWPRCPRKTRTASRTSPAS